MAQNRQNASVLGATKHDIVKRAILERVRTGMYVEGQRLPGGHRLAAEFGVSALTVQTVLEGLEYEGLVTRRRGSGTYVSEAIDAASKIQINIPIDRPDKPLVKHFLGKLRQQCMENVPPAQMDAFRYPVHNSNAEKVATCRQLFLADKPASIAEVTISDIPQFAKENICQDLSSFYAAWPHRDNLYPVAREAVTYNGRIYGIPFHGTLTCLQFHSEILDRFGVDPGKFTSSLEDFLRGLEKLYQSGQFEYSFFAHTRSFLMHLLRALVGQNLHDFLMKTPFRSVDRAIALELFSVIKRMKWQLGAQFVPNANVDDMKKFFTRRIPVQLGTSQPQAFYKLLGAENLNSIYDAPFRWGDGGKPFSFFNSYVWIVNSRIEDTAKEFIFRFLGSYISPQSEQEIDLRHLEEDLVNHRLTCFMRPLDRIPREEGYAARIRSIFEFAEKEIPRPCAAFDALTLGALRIIGDQNASPESEYEFCRTALDEHLSHS